MKIKITKRETFMMVSVEARTFDRLRVYSKPSNEKIGDMRDGS